MPTELRGQSVYLLAELMAQRCTVATELGALRPVAEELERRVHCGN